MRASPQDRDLVRTIRRDIRQLRKEKAAWIAPLVQFWQAALAAMDSQREHAISLLAAAEAGFRDTGSGLYQHVTRRCRGKLLGRDYGDSLVAQADSVFSGQGVANPKQLAATFAPAFEQ